MIKHAARKLTFAFSLVVLTVPAGRAFAQPTTPTTTAPVATPSSVTGTDPEPQGDIVEIILALLQLA